MYARARAVRDHWPNMKRLSPICPASIRGKLNMNAIFPIGMAAL